jgi:hypothetical protein
MPGIINTGSHPKLLWPGIKGIWGYIYNEWRTEYTDLVDSVTSDKNYEEYVQVAGFGFAQIKNQGAAIEYDIEQQGAITRLVNITYALGYIVTMEELQDDLYEKVSKRRASANARSMRLTKEYIVANLYNRAFTAGYTGGDGVTLGSNAHPLVFGGVYSNVPAVPADLSEASLEDGCIQIMGFQDDRGLAAAFMPRSLHISRSELFNATRILDSDYQSGTGNNDVNALKTTGMFPEGIKVNHYFSAARPWFIRSTGVDVGNGLIYQERMGVQFDQDNEFSTKNVAAASVERYQVGWGDARAILAVNAP